MREFSFNLDTRKKILVSTMMLTTLFLTFQRINISNLLGLNIDFEILNPIVLGLITAMLVYWISEFRISGERILTIAAFPAISSFVFSIFIELIFTQRIGQISSIGLVIFTALLFFIFTYIVFLTVNVLNLGYLEDIPLEQAGRAAYYVLNLVTQFIFFLIIISNSLNIFVQVIFILVSTYFTCRNTLWTIREGSGRRFLIGTTISILISYTYLVLLMWPIDVSIISFVMLIILYITLGVAMEIHEKLNRIVWIEYSLLLIIILFILLLISSWGINGSLI